MNWRILLIIFAALLVLSGVFLPRDWYDTLPKNEEIPSPPIKGVTLLQVTLVLEGLVLLLVSFRQWSFQRIEENQRLSILRDPDSGVVGRRQAAWMLAGITLVALGLRLYHISSDLWLDEITPILNYGEIPAWQVVASYYSSNNHLLNTLLVKLMVGWFGEQEWAVRLPAALFGTATIPVLFWVARMAMSRAAALCSALLLATSYHHIFFSQNARGYISHVFFSVLATGLLVRGLQEDRLRTWAGYVVTMLLNLAALLHSAFVFAAHALTAAAGVYMLKRRGVPPVPLLRRLGIALFVAGFLGFQLYATALPQAIMFIRHTYSSGASGFQPLSAEFVKELARGLSAGLGAWVALAAIPALLVAATGFITLARRNWVLMSALTLPLFLLAGALVVGGLTFSPRFFALALPVGILCGVQGLFTLTERLLAFVGPRATYAARIATLVVVLGCGVSLVSLRYYYAVPKQPYRASLTYVESLRGPEDVVIVIHLAEKGYLFYGKRFGIEPEKNYLFVRSVEALDEVLSSHPLEHTYLVTTFPRFLEIHSRELADRVSSGWEVAQRFPATVGDGAITVWKPRGQEDRLGPGSSRP